MMMKDTEGVISGLSGNISRYVDYMCRWRMIAPQQRYLVVAATMLGPQGPCASSIILSFDVEHHSRVFNYKMSCGGNFTKSPVFFLRSNEVGIKCVSLRGRSKSAGMPAVLPRFEIVYKSTTEQLWTRMTPVLTSETTGFVTSPGFDVTRTYSPFLDAWCNVTVPTEHVVMVSFPYFALLSTPRMKTPLGHGSFVSLSAVTPTGQAENEETLHKTEYISPRVFLASVLTVRFVSDHLGLKNEQRSGMNMSFSFHPTLTAPRVLVGTEFFNCSVPHYAAFQQHLHCNMRRECEGREDEGSHCHFSSALCKGGMAAGGKCYFPVDSDRTVSWQRARAECQKKGSELAMMKTPREWEAFWAIPHITANWKCVYLGLYLNPRGLHPLYRKTWMWLDGSPSFEAKVTAGHFVWVDVMNYHLAVKAEGTLLKSVPQYERHNKGCSRFVCENVHSSSNCSVSSNSGSKSISSSSNSSSRSSSSSSSSSNHCRSGSNSNMHRTLHLVRISGQKGNVSQLAAKQLGLFHCPDGHLVHAFLRCYIESHCGVDVATSHCSVSVEDSKRSLTSTTKDMAIVSIAMFGCENKRQTLPYTMVCDFTPDCLDQSDEAFCTHSQPCGKEKSHRCQNGQCVPVSNRCDHKADCWDGSDEEGCSQYPLRSAYDFIFLSKKSGPSSLKYTDSGTYEQTRIGPTEACPLYYFRCPSSHYCLPVYLRCNGVHDCPQSEDESGCENFTCQGLVKCRGSNACVHVSHVCDGFAQCPMKDDEAFCDLQCPHNCYCQGLELVCGSPFNASMFLYTRYLDARHSRTTLSELTANTYLVYVNLASCNITRIYGVTLPNLQILDLSSNFISSVDMDVFLSLKQLRTLRLRDNPLHVFTGGFSEQHTVFLSHLDLSHTRLSSFTSEPLQRFLALRSINISFCRVAAITGRGFQPTPTLQQIDMRGNPVHTYPQSLFKVLYHLRVVFTSNYKLCCPAMLPEGFVKDLCFSPQDELSSCKDLLRSDLYRIFLWLMCSASVAMNLGNLGFRNVTLKTRSSSGFSVFVSSLSLSDCVMGVYLAFVGVADAKYRGAYYLYEEEWLSSVPCSVSGAMSLLSCEVSAITVCLITLDRFIALRFPFSTLKFSRQSALVACVLAWLVGLVLCLIPLRVPSWRFYSQTGICIPLPVTRREFSGQAYSFGVMIVFNFVLFLLVASGQGFIYHSVRMNSMAAQTHQKVRDVTIARRLLTVALSDFLCWFPVGLLGLLASGGFPVPGEVNVAMAIFILPLNSALNPFLYTFNILLERRRKVKEIRILKYLEAMFEPAAERSSQVLHVPHPLYTGKNKAEQKKEALQCLQKALKLHMVSTEQIRTFLLVYGDSTEISL